MVVNFLEFFQVFAEKLGALINIVIGGRNRIKAVSGFKILNIL